MKRSKLIPIAGLALLTLSACGLRGGLERPDPLWGSPDAEDIGAATEVTGAQIDTGIIDRSDETELDDAAPEDELLGGPAEDEGSE